MKRSTWQVLGLIAVACWVTAAPAKTLRFTLADDASTLDPHAANLLVNARILSSVYESLIARDKDFKLVPGLALSWSQPDAKTWRFKLRPNVKFHDGSPFTADDVVFSIERVLHPLSNLKSSVQGVESARKIDDLTVDLIMKDPNPVLLFHLFNCRIMSKAWSTKNNTISPQNYKDKEDTFASRNTNGTGPFKLVSRQPDVKTVLAENPDWWNRKSPERGNVTEIVWQPIKSHSTRSAALMSGEVDFMIDPPVQDRERIKNLPGFKLQPGSEPRIHYLAFDVFRDELQYSSVKGKNPFKDVRVRQAIALAIDVDVMINKINRGFGRSTALIIGKEVQGYQPDMDRRGKVDIARAKKLMADAGYANGFEVTIDCSNSTPFAEICQAMAPMLSQIGIKLTPNIVMNANFAPKVQKYDTSFFHWAWGATTLDALYVVQSLMRSVGEDKSGNGDSNLGRYSNPKMDELVDRIKVEADVKKRDAMIREVLVIQRDDVPLIPIMQTVTAWAMRKNIDGPFATNNIPPNVPVDNLVSEPIRTSAYRGRKQSSIDTNGASGRQSNHHISNPRAGHFRASRISLAALQSGWSNSFNREFQENSRSHFAGRYPTGTAATNRRSAISCNSVSFVDQIDV